MTTEQEQSIAQLLRSNRVLERLGVTPLYQESEVPDLTAAELTWAAETSRRLAVEVAYAMRGIL